MLDVNVRYFQKYLQRHWLSGLKLDFYSASSPCLMHVHALGQKCQVPRMPIPETVLTRLLLQETIFS